VVDTFLLSCRVLGKNVEDTVLAHLLLLGRERNCSEVQILFHRTPKNTPALDFLLRLNARETRSVDGRYAFAISPEVLSEPSKVTKTSFGFRFRRTEEKPDEEHAGPRSLSSDTIADSHRTISLQARILEGLKNASGVLAETALRLQTAQHILHEVRNMKKVRARTQKPFVKPRTPLEENLAQIWGDLIGLECVGIHDNFFDLGGDSLMAVQILSRVREIYHVEVSLTDLFNGAMTIEELASLVEQHLIQQTDSQRLNEMLAYLDSLSDEQVQALIAQGGWLMEKEH